MKRRMHRVVIEPGKVRYKVKIHDYPCTKGTLQSQVRQGLFFQWLFNNFDQTKCGSGIFDTLNISHDGNSWVADLEAIIEEDTDRK